MTCGFTSSFLRLRARFDDLAGWRSSVECRWSRWRAAVLLSTTAHRSESLRTRFRGGCLPRLVGTKSQRQVSDGLYSEGVPAPGASRWRPATVRLCCPVSYGAEPCCWAAVAACGRRVSWVPRRVSAVNGTSPSWRSQAESFLLCSGLVRLDTASSGWLGKPRRRGGGPRTQHPSCGEKDPPNHGAGSRSNVPTRDVQSRQPAR